MSGHPNADREIPVELEDLRAQYPDERDGRNDQMLVAELRGFREQYPDFADSEEHAMGHLLVTRTRLRKIRELLNSGVHPPSVDHDQTHETAVARTRPNS